MTDLLADERIAAWRSLLRCGAHMLPVGGDDGRSKAPMRGWPSWKKNPLSLAEFDDLISRRPARLLGFGIVPGSIGCVVLDVDEGDPSALIAERPPAVKMPSVSGRGWHLWYRAEDAAEIENSAWEAAGCKGDVRGGNGYVVVTRPELLTGRISGGAKYQPMPRRETRAEKKAGLYVVGNRRFALNADVFAAALANDKDKGRAALGSALRAGLPESQAREVAARAWKEGSAALGEERNGEKPGDVELVPLARISPAAVRWTLPEWLPGGCLTILAGTPGIGKSTLAALVAARISRGEPLVEGEDAPDAPAATVWHTTEEAVRETLRPGMEAAGADLGLIHMPLVRESPGDPGREFRAAEDMPRLERAMRRSGARLLVLDPLLDILGSRSSNRAEEVREAAQDLQRLARRTGAAVLGIHHLSKSQHAQGASALERVLGSQAWVAIARMVLHVGLDRSGRIVAMRGKNSFGPARGGAALRIEGCWVEGDEPIPTKRMIVLGPVEGTADQVLTTGAWKETDDDGPAKTAAEEWMRQYFADPEPSPWQDVEERGRAEGFSAAALRKARDALRDAGRIECRREREGRDSPYVWMAADSGGREK